MTVVALLIGFIVTAVAITIALGTSPKALWLAAFASWFLSFLGAWTIGLYTLVATFVLVALALGYSFGWIRSTTHAVIAVVIGVLAWALALRTIDDYWLFFPLSGLLS